jgi:hypothetical protein
MQPNMIWIGGGWHTGGAVGHSVTGGHSAVGVGSGVGVGVGVGVGSGIGSGAGSEQPPSTAFNSISLKVLIKSLLELRSCNICKLRTRYTRQEPD